MTNSSELFSPAALAERCLAACDGYLEACRAVALGMSDPAAAAVSTPSPMSFLAPWQAFAQSMGMSQDGTGLAQFMNPAAGPPSPFAGSMPGLGWLREHQETGQRMLELSKRFNACYAQLVRHGVFVNQQALRAMQSCAADDASLLDSPRRSYDAWIDSAERAYAQLAHSDAFAQLLAELCNILSAFKIERSKLLEYIARLWDLPSRAEIDALHREVRALRENARRAASKGEAAVEEKSTKISEARPRDAR